MFVLYSRERETELNNTVNRGWIGLYCGLGLTAAALLTVCCFFFIKSSHRKKDLSSDSSDGSEETLDHQCKSNCLNSLLNDGQKILVCAGG